MLTEVRKELRLLARDEWGGFDGMGGLAAAFVMPNDPAIAPILKKAGDVLQRFGHSYCGVWLTEKTLPSLVERDSVEIRKALAARELIVFETTGVTSRPADPFEQAIVIGQSHTNEKNVADFVGAIDIARSRASQIRPMAAHQAMAQTGKEGGASIEAAELPLPNAWRREKASCSLRRKRRRSALSIGGSRNMALEISVLNCIPTGRKRSSSCRSCRHPGKPSLMPT